MRLVFKLIFAFAFMVSFLEAVIAAAKWWRGETLLWWEWGLAGLLPVLIGVYFRFFSVFGCGKGQCLAPPDKQQD